MQHTEHDIVFLFTAIYVCETEKRVILGHFFKIEIVPKFR